MPEDTLASLRQLPDDELVARVKELAARERDAVVELVAHLSELETRDIPLRAGYGSLFVYCRDVLRLSEHDAYNHIEAARAARRFPVLLEMLGEGSLNLTTVRLLARHLTSENHRAVLDSARGKRKTEVEEIVAALWPLPDVPPSFRKLPGPRLALPPAAPRLESAAPKAPAQEPLPAQAVLPARPSAPVASAVPLSPDRYKVQFTVAGETLEKLRLAKDMLRHAIPFGDDAAIFDRALTTLLADLAKKKFAATDQPGPSRGTAPGSRHIPAEVKRAVWLRDLGLCAFVGTNGRRCAERGFLEFHHVEPFAAGGEATVANVQLRCRRHNGYEARVYFGGDPRNGGSERVREEEAPYAFRPREPGRTDSFRNE